jgi:hypothetical protein
MEPDGGACDFNWVFHFDRGQINGVDVSGLNLAMIGHLDGAPGAAAGAVRLAVFVDDRSSTEQQDALLAAYTGQLGGPLAELAGLVGEVVAVERVPIEFDADKGSGSVRAGDVLKAEFESLNGPDGKPTTISNFALSGVLGGTVYPGTPTVHELNASQYGFDFTARTSDQFEFSYHAA